MINWFWKHKTLMHRMPVLMALLAGLMFIVQPGQARPGEAMPVGKSYAFTSYQQLHEQLQKDNKSASGEELPVYKPGCQALAQVAPLQFFFFQQAPVPVITPLVEIVEQAPAGKPRPINRLHRTLFRQIISPNAP